MASFDGKIGTPSEGFTLKVEYSYTQSVANNNSVISSIKGYCKKNNSSYYPYNSSKTAKIKIERLDNSDNWVEVKTLSNSDSYSFNGVSTSTYLEFVSGSNITIPHKSNGEQKLRITFEVDGKLSSYYPKGSISSTPKLTSIPRYATANQSLNSKTSSSIKMNWSSDSTIDYIWYSKDNGTSWTGVEVTDGTSGSYTISGLSSNTTYNLKTRVRRKDSQLTTDSSALSVTTHAKTVPTISLSSKTSSSITVTSGCNVTVSSTQYRIKKSSGTYGSYQTSATFSGLSANTTYVVEVKKVGSASGEAGTATVTVTTHQKTIPTISLSSKTVSSITVTSGCNVAVSSTQYRIKTSSGSYGSYQSSAIFSGLSPNTTYVVEVKKVGQASGESGTTTLTVNTYQIATIDIANFNLGDSFNIKITNPSGQSIEFFAETLINGQRENTIRVTSISAGTHTITFSDGELDMIYKKMGTGNSALIRIGVRTVGTYYDWKDVTCTLTGNQKTTHIGVNGSKKRAKVYLGVNGSVKRAVVWIGNNGRKRCI